MGCHDFTAVMAAPRITPANMMHGIAPAPAVALAVEGISYSYGPRQALADVTFSIAPATFAVLLGLNGAGKTTLFSLITRLYGTQRGQIRILGHDVARTPGDALRLIGVVFQSRTLDLDLSVMQNLIYHAALHGIGRRAARRRASEMLDQIDLADRAQDKVRNLSGGQMRRVEIARALLHRPRLLVLDEPTVGLDVKSRADILAQCAGWWLAKGPVCCGRRISSTRFPPTMTSSSCITVMCWPAGRSHAWCRTPAPRTFGAHSHG